MSLFTAERARCIQEAGVTVAAQEKMEEVLRLAGTKEPPGYWRKNNWSDLLALEPGGWARFPRLARLPMGLLGREVHPEVRIAACRWLRDFALLEVVEALGVVLLDPTDERKVREEAALTLGARQLYGRDETLFVSPAIATAADALLARAVREGLVVPAALRHCSPLHGGAVDDALLELPVADAARSVDAFATPALARRLVRHLDDVPMNVAGRIAGLVASVLGAEAASHLVDHANRLPITARIEVLFAAFAVDRERSSGPLAGCIEAMPLMRTWPARREWHERHPGVLPVTRALATARRLAEIPPGERTRAAAGAARDFAARGGLEPFGERDLDELWEWMAVHSREPARIDELPETRRERALALLHRPVRRSPMPSLTPYRISFLAPTLTLPKGADAAICAELIHLAVNEVFLRDPLVAAEDPTTSTLTSEGRILDRAHPEADELIRHELTWGARNEVLWLDVDLTKPSPVKLSATSGTSIETFPGLGPSLGAALESALSSWRAARGLGEARSRIEPFTASGVLDAAARIAAKDEAPPAELVIPWLRARGGSCHAAILEREPDHPWALFDRYVEVEHRESPKDFAPLLRIVAAAPTFRPPYLHLRGEGLDSNDALDALAVAAALDPSDGTVLASYGRALTEMGRHEAGHHLARRAHEAEPNDYGHVVAALETATELVRPGYHLDLANAFIAEHEGGPLADFFDLGHPDVRFCYLSRANAHLFAGRHAEAIELRTAALAGTGGSWPNQTKVLERWRSSPDTLANATIAAGRARGDLGRVLGAGLPTTSGAIAGVVEAFCLLGQPTLAALAFAHAASEGPRQHPVARLAGARAAMESGDLSRALAEVLVVVLRHGRQRYRPQIDRILRTGAALGAEVWQREITGYRDRGATRLAQLLAREAADFVPGFEKKPAKLPFDAKWLGGLAKRIGAKAAAKLDDAMTGEDDLVATAFLDAVSSDEELLYVATSALCRYLRRPAGGHRQAAGLAFEMLHGRELPLEAIRLVLEALEPASAGVDPWLFDEWLLTVERALRIEDRAWGKLEAVTTGLPTVAAHLRGDLGIGLELAAAARLAKSDPGASYELYERCIRAGCSSNIASLAVPLAKDPIDAAWTALSSSTFAASPAVVLARRAFDDGKPELARSVLSAHLGKGSARWRDAQVAELAAAWKASGLDVPIDFDEAQTAGLTALQGGDFEKALRCYEWCNAIDPKNAVTLKNLGMVCARLGRPVEALDWFSQADRKQAPTWTAHELMVSKKWTESLVAHRYAALGYDRADLFIYAAKSAWFAGDDEAKLEAILRAKKLDPKAVDLTFLNGLADAAATYGLDDLADAAARELLKGGKGNPTWESLANYHLGTVLLRQKKYPAAQKHAEAAVRLNKAPDNAADFEALVAACKKKKPKKPTARRADEPEARAWALLGAGDPAGASKIAKAGKSGALALARVAVARWRDDEDPPVPPALLRAARAVVEATVGATELADTTARAAALEVLEDAFAKIDPAPALGRIGPRDPWPGLLP